MKYIAKKYKPELLGNTAADVGRIEMLAAQVHTLKMKATMPCYTTGDKDEIIEECRPLLKKLMDVKGTDTWLAGNNLSWVDFYFAELLDLLENVSEGIFYAELPACKQYFDAFVKLPGMAEYWKTCMKAPFNNKMAKLLNE